MKISFQSGDWRSVSIYTIAYLIFITITFVRNIPFKIRVWIGLSLFYVIGITSFLTFGPIGSGRIWLLSFAVLSSILLGLRAGLIALFLNICTIFILAAFLNTEFLAVTSLSYTPSEYWFATGLSFIFLSTVITISIGVLVAGLEKNLRKEQSLTRDLKLSNERLERENTERRVAEESLQKSQERFKTLTNNLNVGIYRNTIGPEGRFLEANPAIVKMFDYESKNKFLDIKVSDLYINPEERKIFNEKMLQKGFVSNEELLLRKKNGDPIICSVSSVAIKDKNGQIKFYDGAIEDITERKRLESKIQQAQKMKAVGTLAGGVAHDLNNILSGIVSYPELILMDLPKDSPLEAPIKKIQESGEKAAATVQDLLTLARRGVPTAEIVNLNDIVSEYLISPEFQKLNTFHPLVKIEKDLDTTILNIMGSPIHLSKTVMNLVSNAAEAMVEGGKISISTENKYIDRPISNYDDVEEGDYVLLTVSDTGAGIAAEEIGRIFEPFYTKKVMGRSGTGLGMAVVWGTVKDHKGYIHVESELNKGTTFKLYFPITRKEKNEDQKSKDLFDYMGNGESILVVDDVEEQREIASKILSQLGYSVKTASRGEEAVKFLSKETADLIILDMIMPPGIDGLETYERIIAIRPNQKAIIASGFSETHRVKKAQRLGVGTYVRKPYTIEKIGLAVRSELAWFDTGKKHALFMSNEFAD
jgi:PAS domain S-box-containing protein